MKHHYRDITDRIGEPPKWWDEAGVPRYSEFKPDESADIYADQVALVLIRCQNCRREFQVCMSSKRYFDHRLHEQIMDHSLHYGDPPNYGCCPAGPTMNSEPIRVLEFWFNNPKLEWERHEPLEVALSPDD